MRTFVMRTQKHYEDMLSKNPNASVGFALAADMVYAARHGSIDTPNVHGDEEWKNIARNLKSRYCENLTVEQVRHEMMKMDFQYLTLLEILFPDRMDKENKNRLQFLRKKIEGEKNVQD